MHAHELLLVLLDKSAPVQTLEKVVLTILERPSKVKLCKNASVECRSLGAMPERRKEHNIHENAVVLGYMHIQNQ